MENLCKYFDKMAGDDAHVKEVRDMLRIVLTLILVIVAVGLTSTARGLALLGPARPMLFAALLVMGILQGYRLSRLWQARKRGDLLKSIPKRPLGI